MNSHHISNPKVEKVRLKIILLLQALTLTLSYGQYDWRIGELVLKNGDTIRGYINLPMFSSNPLAFRGKEKVKFKKERTSKKEKFDENQVETIIFRNSDTEVAYFKFIPYSKKRNGLFKIIISGKATLYARAVSVSSGAPMFMPGSNGGTWMHGGSFGSSSNDDFYVLRDGEEFATRLVTAGINSFKKRAIEYFTDCPLLVEKINSNFYSKRDIREVVNEYNDNCQ